MNIVLSPLLSTIIRFLFHSHFPQQSCIPCVVQDCFGGFVCRGIDLFAIHHKPSCICHKTKPTQSQP
jgi:hypothetical protein